MAEPNLREIPTPPMVTLMETAEKLPKSRFRSRLLWHLEGFRRRTIHAFHGVPIQKDHTVLAHSVGESSSPEGPWTHTMVTADRKMVNKGLERTYKRSIGEYVEDFG